MVKVGDYIRILRMTDEPEYTGRQGYVTSIDDMGYIHTTCGGLALIPDEDEFVIIEKQS